MRIYVVDGSTKGISLGAGVVEVLETGFIETHSFHSFHAKPTSIIAEMYAFKSALELIIKLPKKVDKVVVYTDNEAVFKYFWQEVNKVEKDVFIDEIKKQVMLLKKLPGFTVKKVDNSIRELATLSHHLSREYISNPLCNQLFGKQPEKKPDVAQLLAL